MLRLQVHAKVGSKNGLWQAVWEASLLLRNILASWNWSLVIMGWGREQPELSTDRVIYPWHVGCGAGHGGILGRFDSAWVVLMVSWAVWGGGDLDKSRAAWRCHRTAQIARSYTPRPGSVSVSQGHLHPFHLPFLYPHLQRAYVCQKIIISSPDPWVWTWIIGKTRCQETGMEHHDRGNL